MSLLFILSCGGRNFTHFASRPVAVLKSEFNNEIILLHPGFFAVGLLGLGPKHYQGSPLGPGQLTALVDGQQDFSKRFTNE